MSKEKTFRILIALITLFCSLSIQTFGTEKQVLKNSDFKRSPRPDVINNRDVKQPPPQGALTNKDFEKYRQKDRRVTRPRRVANSKLDLNKASFEKKRTDLLLTRKEILEERISQLQSELNELQTRVLQNRPIRTNVIGDPYFVDPEMREKITKLKSRINDAELEYQSVLAELDKR
jgi:hypothetical protein